MIELRPAILRIASIAAAWCLFPATGGWGEVRERPSRFESYLVLGYSEVSAIADRNGEADLAKHFLARAKLAVADQPVAPETPAGSSLSAWTMHEASLAREQFLARLEGGAREEQPLLAAIAQANFDCWVAPLQGRIGVPDGDECRRRFYFAFAGLRARATPERGPSNAVELAATSGAAAAKASRTAEPECLGGPVYLDCPPIAFTGVAADDLIRLLRGFTNSDAPAMEGALSSAQAPGGGQAGDSSSRGSSGTTSSTASSSGSASSASAGGGSTGGSVSASLGGALNDASGTVGNTVGDAAGAVGSTVGDASGAIGGTVDAVGDTVGGAVGSTGTAVGGAVSGVGRAAGSLLK